MSLALGQTAPFWSAPGCHTLTLLDGFGLARAGQPLSVQTGGQRLLALLALAGTQDRAVAAGMLWPEVSESRAHGCLRTALWRLQRLWPGLIAVADHRITLNTAVLVDITLFVDRAVRAIREPVRSAHELCLEDLTAGELLPGWYDDWVIFERERLRQLRMHALERLSEQLMDSGRCALALEAALEAVRMEPLRESAHAAVISVHLAEHNTVEARRHFQAVTRLLRAELHVEPSERLRALVGSGT